MNTYTITSANHDTVVKEELDAVELVRWLDNRLASQEWKIVQGLVYDQFNQQVFAIEVN